ncbi:hypothetical protein LJ114_07435 [Propionibacterium freudenreichii]|uniref:Uncharacterized protein n=2 Tax=Propionibacterium freudenreichii TaxID=1744 RepID=A0A2C7AJM6_9ACTN|nr:hypothetical protein [Propionibacterium freudenreichii]MCT2977862.1 hypothetical protein [Propionibacterium freudenreichii]MCT2979508.1 hypothetical protein [Propionibacterium freudenreichii]MCT2983686.1 hypothetical protein [Propionibacterium freudenreichii]MCT2986264.1 hypothetical protein [Propionibacterium freudenreichii]MCT2988868.1 hypothetical protein [Propionibacterium freudenreichii]
MRACLPEHGLLLPPELLPGERWSCPRGRSTQVIGEENHADELAHLLDGQSRCHTVASLHTPVRPVGRW